MCSWLSCDYHAIIIKIIILCFIMIIWWTLPICYWSTNKQTDNLNCIWCWLSCDHHGIIIWQSSNDHNWSTVDFLLTNKQANRQTNKQTNNKENKQTNMSKMMIMWLSWDYHKMIIICSYNNHLMIFWISYDYRMMIIWWSNDWLWGCYI